MQMVDSYYLQWVFSLKIIDLEEQLSKHTRIKIIQHFDAIPKVIIKKYTKTIEVVKVSNRV